MIDFKTAEEAYKETKANSQRITEKQLDEVIKAINNAIELEKYSVTFSKLSSETVDFLRNKMGYKVTQRIEEMQMQVYTISWSHFNS